MVANINRMKSSWFEFQSLTPGEIQEWKDKCGRNRMHHKEMKMQQTPQYHVMVISSDHQLDTNSAESITLDSIF